MYLLSIMENFFFFLPFFLLRHRYVYIMLLID